MARKKRKELSVGPIVTIVILFVVVILLSFILSKIGVTTNKSEIINGEISTTNVGVRNILSKEGMDFVFSSIVSGLQNFNVLYLFVISMLGIGFAESVGLFKQLFKNVKKYKLSFIIMLTLVVGCLMGALGPTSYAFLLPLTAYVYKNLNKNPIAGVVSMFFALTIGQTASLFPTYFNQILGSVTEISARITVDSNYVFKSSSLIYIFISSFFLFVLLGSAILDKYLIPKLPKMKAEEEIEELEVNNGGLKKSTVAFFIMLLLIAYLVVPGLPYSGALLGESGTYLERLFGEASLFKNSYIFIFTLILIVCGTVYGISEKKIRSFDDFTRSFSKCFSGLSMVFVLIFLIAQLVAIINYSEIDIFFTSLMVNWLSLLKITGLGLILIYFLVIIMVSVILPDTSSKWAIVAPIVVPLLMRANMSASFAQFIFMAAEGIGKSFSILFPYSAILFGLIYKYTDSGNYGFLKVYKMLSNIIILFTIVWLTIIITWYVVGIPTGINVLPSL